ncbi:MAG TPA: flagellar export chaperone FliS [Alphaproteobacteria bacterium]|nr:flagellar export chaperone FliS [Alphaproteobacteria bacterium]
MTFQDYLNEHRKEIVTSSATRLAVMLYDEAIRQLNIAIKAVSADDIATRYNATAMTANLIEQLHSSLDFAQGGEIAEQLGMIYRFILSRLPRINLFNDSEIAAQIIDLLEPLRDSWHALDQHQAAEHRRHAVKERVAAVA